MQEIQLLVELAPVYCCKRSVLYLFITIPEERPDEVILLSKREHKRQLRGGDPTSACLVRDQVRVEEARVRHEAKIGGDDDELSSGKSWRDSHAKKF